MFDLHLNWICQIQSRCVFNASNRDWIGEVSLSGVHDRYGNLVLWNGEDEPRKILRPRRPATPGPMGHMHRAQKPNSPGNPDIKLLDQFNGWSPMSFEAWLRGDEPNQDWIDLGTL